MDYLAAINKFQSSDLQFQIRNSLEWIGWQKRIFPDTRLWIKPNLTFPEYRPGVTTSPHFMNALLTVLRERTPYLTVFESDGGNNSYPMEKAFQNHHLYEICAKHDVRLVNLSRQPWQYQEVTTQNQRPVLLPMSKEMLADADMTISVPVPKMHFVTRYTGAIKNFWGTNPDTMRLKYHYILNFAINALMQNLKAGITVVDGEYFLDNNGPVTGQPVKMDTVIAADYPLTADMVLMNIMGVDPQKIGYIRTAWQRSPGPRSLQQIALNQSLSRFKTHGFQYQRDPVDYLALLGFHSRLITYWVYLSPLRQLVHQLVGLLRGGSRQVESYYSDVLPYAH